MKIVALSDQHGSLPEVPEADIVIIAGDVCPLMNHDPKYQRTWLTNIFGKWLLKIKAKHIVGIGGNHDNIFESAPIFARHLPWNYLQDEEIELEGLRIWGTPWVPNLPLWAFHKAQWGLREVHEKIPEGIDILVSHGPPAGVGDEVRSSHVGDDTLNSVLRRVEPRLHVFGHIHEGHGRYPFEESNMELANVALKDGEYKLVHEPMEFEL